MARHANKGLCVAGFKEDGAILMGIAKRLKVESLVARESYYQAGELSVRLSAQSARRAIVVDSMREEPASLVKMLFLASALRHAGAKRVELLAPWIAYGRQDRPSEEGMAPAGLVVAGCLADAFDRIATLDAHSPAFIQAFAGRLVNVFPEANPALAREYDAVAAPDKGAIERASHFAKTLKLPIILMEKKRHGPRLSVCVMLSDEHELEGKRVLLVDDLADSGNTLFAAAQVLKDNGAERVGAFVSHTADRAALTARSKGILFEVRVVNDHASGAIEPAILDQLCAALRASWR